jgi:CheY-like chemotaxis protein
MAEQHPKGSANLSGDCVVLYVEDDDATAYLFQHALQHHRIDLRLFRVRDGEKALAFIFREGIYRDAPAPHLVILDLHLPRKSGFEVLSAIRAAASVKTLPVVVFTSSTRSEDRDQAMALGANEFFIKRADWEEFLSAAKSICDLVPPRSGGRHRAADREANHIDYCLPDLGIRVWEASCRLIAKADGEWLPIGASRDLPLGVPAGLTALASVAGDALLLTAWQYEREHPGTDLGAVLSQTKVFSAALTEHH